MTIDAGGRVTAMQVWQQNADGSYTKGEIVNLKVGDYVNYDLTKDATDSLTYTSYSETNASATKNNGRTNGYDSDQSFDAATYKNAEYGWRVLDIKNGKIRLISDEYVGPGTYTNQSRTEYCLKGYI